MIDLNISALPGVDVRLPDHLVNHCYLKLLHRNMSATRRDAPGGLRPWTRERT